MCFRIPEILGVPGMGAFLNPLSRTRTVPIYPVPPKIYQGGTFNWGSYIVGEQLVWQSFRPFVNKWLRDQLGLPPAPFLGPQWKASLRGDPILYGFSPSVVPR